MTADTTGNPAPRRRERRTGHRRSHRLPVSFDDAELEVVRRAARREGLAPPAWAGIQLMAVAQEKLVPVSADAGDVLRELVQARARLRETVSALRALNHPAPPAPVPGPPAPGTAPVPVPGLPAPGTVPATVESVLEQTLVTVSRLDQATVQIMRERRSRS
ncbi:hypothetical protein NW249_24000 [Streptomyces sp. OUCMDZ-4982]|uniref:hypothetical protein n=1 Tax=Streptomyces sp. OUCMDZ-4982 TaxID=2973090 RepID=UPI00215C8C4D|nr:hypothetical protein [Streptomyces sp. OUCMDZ-4982]MCR8945184.1 hypothetical protein [Streptomyces sp. OUCMDZ-4982]